MVRFEIGDNVFEAVLDALPAPIFVVDKDVRMHGYNSAAVPLFNSEPDRILRMGCGDAFYCIHSAGTPQGCGGGDACKKCVIRNSVKKSCGGDRVIRANCEMQLVRGKKIENIRMFVTTVPLQYKDELYALVILEDIDGLEHAGFERPQAEEVLQDSDKRYRSLFDNNHSAMLLIDPESADIVDANPAAIAYYGWSLEELTAKKITDVNVLTEAQIFQEMEKAKSEQRRHFIFRHRFANGDIRDVEVYSGPIGLYGKKLLYSIIHDITERIQAEEDREKLINELQEALKEIKTLRGILPLCSFCKKIRNDKGYWEQVDVYIHKHSQADISHSICPDCYREHYPDVELFDD